jgi:hypothetical protein
MHQFDPDQAAQTVRDCLCSDCWGQLIARYDPKTRLSVVKCSTDGCSCNGFVSRKGVVRREAESGFELVQVKQALRNVLPQSLPEDEQAILKSLGF